MAAHSPAFAIKFVQVGDGASQTLNWNTSPFCTNYTEGMVWSVDGRILSQPARATLDWTGQDALQVVAYGPLEYTHYSLNPCSDAWVAIEARQVPLVFQVQAEPDDPLPLQMDLHVAPAMAGTLDMRAGIGGNPGSITLTLQMTMTVKVNGQLVSADSLNQVQTISNGQTMTWSPALPKGAANQVTIPGVTGGSLIEIRLWFYRRLGASDYTDILSSGPFGHGIALVINAQPINVVGVAEESQAEHPRLGICPNPSPGAARIDYTLPRASRVRLAVYDIAGSRVATLADRMEEAGRGEMSWDGRGARGERLPPGVYVVELLAGTERRVSRLVLLSR